MNKSILTDKEIEFLGNLYTIIKTKKIFLNHWKTFEDLINYFLQEKESDKEYIKKMIKRKTNAKYKIEEDN